MATRSPSRSPLERQLAYVVRYWAFNMNLIHVRGSYWPGFGYSDAEKVELAGIAAKVPGTEYYAWIFLQALIVVAIIAAFAALGMYVLIQVIGGEQNMATTPEPLFFLTLAVVGVAGLSIGMPAGMLAAATAVGRFFQVPDEALPDREATLRYFRKLWFQITRLVLVLMAALIPLWLFVPADSKVEAALRLLAPLLSPTVGVLTGGYYLIPKATQKPSDDPR